MTRAGYHEGATLRAVEVAVVVAHPTVRELIVTLLERSEPSWTVTATGDSRPVAARLGDDAPDVVVVDASDVARCCRATFAAFPREQLVVIGPQPGVDYERAARRTGVGAGLPRDRLADELPAVVRAGAANCLTHHKEEGDEVPHRTRSRGLRGDDRRWDHHGWADAADRPTAGERL